MPIIAPSIPVIELDFPAVHRGDTFEYFLTDKDPEISGVDLSAYTYKMQIRTKDTNAALLLELNSTNGGITATTHQIRLHRTAIEMRVAAGSYNYDFEATETATGKVRTWFKGNFKILKDITVNG